MLTDVQALIFSALLTWAMLVTASFLRNRLWTPSGMKLGMGNRDDVPEPTPLAARADRAAKNMLENLVLFVCVVVAARYAGAPAEQVNLGSTIFFWARLLYFGVYLAGIAYLRTAVWAVAVLGLFIIARAAL
jgi:uncharacterized MAPEG superfamily protein